MPETTSPDVLSRPADLLQNYAETHERNADLVAETLEESPAPSAEIASRLSTIADRFDLSTVERDALLLAIAPDLDSRFDRAYSRIQTDGTLRRPTVELVVDVLETTDASTAEALAAVSQASPLVRWELLDLRRFGPRRPYQARIVYPAANTLAYLFGETTDPDPATVRSPDYDLDALPVGPSTRDRLEALPIEDGGRYSLAGGDASVRRQAVDAVAKRTGRDVVSVEAATIANDDLAVRRVARETILRDAILHLTSVDALDADRGPPAEVDEQAGESGGDPALEPPPGPALDVADLLDRFDAVPTVVLSGAEPWIPTDRRDERVAVIELPDPGYDLRQTLWSQRTDALPADVDPTELAGTFRLTQGEIDDALETARAVAASGEISREDLYRGCRYQSSAALDDLAERIEPTSEWSDIVLPETTERDLRQVATQIAERGTVYSEWGFEQAFSRGIGVVALFSGPSGTGKTMAAEVLANHVGLDLYRIDLSTIVSKYVGETESNLERIFDAAERSSAILLFDEADAVFGARSEVSEGTDRYANVEVNYLLQRIEGYDGVVVLTSNYESNIDEAFTRRIHRHVEFERPDRPIRERLWRELVPERTPTEDLDYEFLASFELAGGDVRNAIQAAAFRAAGDDDPLRMCHVVPAVRRELEKSGSLVDPTEFGAYRDFLDA